MADLIPREVLFGNPERVSPHISPDGSQLAWIAPRDGVLNVWVAPIGASGASGVDWDAATVVTDDTDRGIRMFAWARDGRHLLYLQDTGGDENWRLYDVDMETMARRDLTPFDGIQARIIATRKSHRDEVLVGINRDNPQLHDVYRLSLTSGELVKLIENPGYAGWLADEDMVVRGAISPLPDGGFDLLVRDSADADWRTLLTITADDVAASNVLAFSGDGTSLLVISSLGTDTGRLSTDRPGHRRDPGAARRPRGGRGGRDAPPGHQGAADRRGAQGPHRVPRARPVGGSRLQGDPGASPR